MAASVRLMASVLFPEPPFWVVNTIVGISGPLAGLWAVFGLRLTKSPHSAAARRSSPQTYPARSKGEIADVRISHLAMMQECGILAIPGEHGHARISLADA
jgi:hypothetical protein